MCQYTILRCIGNLFGELVLVESETDENAEGERECERQETVSAGRWKKAGHNSSQVDQTYSTSPHLNVMRRAQHTQLPTTPCAKSFPQENKMLFVLLCVVSIILPPLHLASASTSHPATIRQPLCNPMSSIQPYTRSGNTPAPLVQIYGST